MGVVQLLHASLALGSAVVIAAASGMVPSDVVANDLAAPTTTASVASTRESIDRRLLSDVNEEEQRDLGPTVVVNIFDLEEDCGKNGFWVPECEEKGYGPNPYDVTYCDAGNVDPDEVTTVTVKWYITIETNSEDSEDIEEMVCEAIEEIVVEALAEECDSRRRRLGGGRRLGAIEGYGETITCEYDSQCETDSGSCSVYAAEVDVAYDEDESDPDDVVATVEDIAEDAGEEAKDQVNEEIMDDGNEVTSVGFGRPDEETEVTPGISGERFVDTAEGLSAGEKVAIAAGTALLLLLLLLCCLWRRMANRRDVEGSKSVGSDETYATSGARGLGSDGDNASYTTTDFNNLGLHHSKLDVHHCNSGTCEQCNPPVVEDSPTVSFVSSSGAMPLASIMEDDREDILSGYSSTKEPEFASEPENANEGEHEEKKGLFSRFRRPTSPPPPPPPPHDPVIRQQEPTNPDEMTSIEVEI